MKYQSIEEYLECWMIKLIYDEDMEKFEKFELMEQLARHIECEEKQVCATPVDDKINANFNVMIKSNPGTVARFNRGRCLSEGATPVGESIFCCRFQRLSEFCRSLVASERGEKTCCHFWLFELFLWNYCEYSLW